LGIDRGGTVDRRLSEPEGTFGLQHGAGNLEEQREPRPSFDIVGSRVALGPLRRDLLPLYRRWRDGFFALRAMSGDAWSAVLDEESPWYDDMVLTDEHAWFTIYELKTLRPIGITGLIDIDQNDQSAEFFLHIGEVASQARDYGTETGRLMLEYAFVALKLETLFLMTYEFNLSELRSYERVGFREFGRQRQAHLKGGRLWDVIYLEVQAHELPNLDRRHELPPTHQFH
jgi:RimJ/RimL family protein N-acetyltransferase